jgi:low temperature requirement protein LtrA
MATGVPGAYAGDGLWFALPYIVVRLLGLGLQVMVELERPVPDHGTVWRWVAGSLIGLGLVLVGAVADPTLRPYIWTAAIAVDLITALIAGSGEWSLDTTHISERHGLFVIIAIGESLIIAGTGLTEETRTESLIIVSAATLVVACTMWWSYFDWLKEAMEHAFARAPAARLGQLARDAFSVAHFPLIGGIVGFAVAIKEILHHPDTPLTTEALAMLGVGIALFIGSAALAYWRLSGRILVGRLVVMAVVLAALPFVAPLPPIWPLVVVAAGLITICVLEEFRAPEPVAEPGH